MTDQEERDLQEKYDQRRPYQPDAVPHGDRPDTMRFRRAGTQEAAALPEHAGVDASAVQRDDDELCAATTQGREREAATGRVRCGITVVVDAEEQAWTRQRVPFGSSESAAPYGRRSGVEHVNAEIKPRPAPGTRNSRQDHILPGAVRTTGPQSS